VVGCRGMGPAGGSDGRLTALGESDQTCWAKLTRAAAVAAAGLSPGEPLLTRAEWGSGSSLFTDRVASTRRTAVTRPTRASPAAPV
jgi:hypothetical protein